MLLNCSIEKDSWESLGLQGIKPFNPKRNQSWMFIGRTDFEAEAPILWPPDVKNWLFRKDAGKDWSQEEKGTTEDEMVGWCHRFDGVWASSGSWWLIGKPSVLQSMGSQRAGRNWVTELNCYLTFAWLWKWVLP